MDLLKATITTVSPLTVTIDGDTVSQPGTLLTGTPTVNAVCYLAYQNGTRAPLVLVAP